mmetsp:Transcript_42914/g.110609  ORF Transcript_42914/g.110609 Transcript_42914/m.110609 type:complete len:239 (-) Transcript_42914:36-752(-)
MGKVLDHMSHSAPLGMAVLGALLMADRYTLVGGFQPRGPEGGLAARHSAQCQGTPAPPRRGWRQHELCLRAVLVPHALAPCSLTWTRGDLQVVARPRRQGHRERQPRCCSHPFGGLQGTLAYCGPLVPARPILRESSGLLRPDALPHGCPQGTPRRGPLARRHARRSLRCDLGRPHAPGHGPPRAARRSGGVPRKPPTTPSGGRSRGPDPTCLAFSEEAARAGSISSSIAQPSAAQAT